MSTWWTQNGFKSPHREHRVHTLAPFADTDSKVHGTNMGPTWDLSAPDGPHVGPMNLAIGGGGHIDTYPKEKMAMIIKHFSNSFISYISMV